MRTEQQMARAAGRLARKWLPVAKQSAHAWVPSARQSGKFVKHVLPAAFKPVHSLWHEILGFVFLVFAGLGAWKIWQRSKPMPPAELAIVVVFIVVMASYGVSSIRKARRISRS
jgi:hypothetical protein